MDLELLESIPFFIGDLLHPGITLMSSTLQVDSLSSELPGKSHEKASYLK